ncbi:MAG TPA: DNA polymerase/3'-5' exonuclease PolX [Thermoanaerobaculia bacterium]|jgi:DNA polymerase (family 10)|nr:DNA polymerase/3'-5' exonuclease PolX [Thermoanaerobaculia bacterium]
MDNPQIARVFEEIADVLEIQNANPFRIRAYRNAVRTVEAQATPLRRMVEEGRALTDLPGIGKEMAAHIQEMVATGTLGFRDELLAAVPRSLIELVRLPGLGPKKARKLWDDLKIQSVDELEAAAKAGRIAAVPGFGAKTQEKILAGIAEHRQHVSRLLLSEAERSVEPLLAWLREIPDLERLEVAGSYRRRCETVGDIDLVAISPRPVEVMERFRAYGQIEKILMAGDTRSTVVLGSGLQVDLRAVPPECYGAALVYFTGSKEHNVKLRRRAVERGLRISEYGVFRADQEEEGKEECIAGREEADVYATVGLPWIPPEMREDRGEIEAAAAGRLPRLLTREDLRGDLHMHSTWSDGRNTIEEMVEACAARGYEYMVISDHSKALAMTNGLDAYRLRLQWKEIEGIERRHPGIRILKAMEIDILADGSLDLEDEMLAGLDLVLVSLHSRLDLPEAEQTARVLRALEHPEVNVFCHPTARLINRRKPAALDIDTVLRRAAALGVAVELNSNPRRLDLKDSHLLLAKELGCKIVINTDSHRTTELDLMRFGVEQARRAWLTPGDVLNTLPADEMLQALARSR